LLISIQGKKHIKKRQEKMLKSKGICGNDVRFCPIYFQTLHCSVHIMKMKRYEKAWPIHFLSLHLFPFLNKLTFSTQLQHSCFLHLHRESSEGDLDLEAFRRLRSLSLEDDLFRLPLRFRLRSFRHSKDRDR